MSKTIDINETIEGLIDKLDGSVECEAVRFIWRHFNETIPALQEDKKRLDWLLCKPIARVIELDESMGTWQATKYLEDRTNIDEAMKEEA